MKKLLRIFGQQVESRHQALLRQIRIFRTLNRRQLGLLELILHERTYLAEEVVFEEGDQGLGMYIVLEGNVKIVRRGIVRNLSGRQEIGSLGPGEAFGEMALLDGVKRSATAIAASSPTRLLSLFQPEFLHLLETHPRIGFKISYEMARILAERFRTTLEKDPTSEALR